MKIAVNTRLLLPDKLEGIGWFSYETLRRIVEKHPEHEFLFIFDRSYSEEFIFAKNVTPVVIRPPARHPFLYYLWFEWLVPPVLRKRKVDLLVSPDGYLCLNSEKPQLAVIHDINFEYYPKYIPWVSRKYYKYFFPKYAQKALRIATVSQFSKEDLVGQYEVNPEKIDVVYNGVDPIYKPISRNEIEATRKKLSSGLPYFIFVGSIQPRKNLIQMFRAFDRFRKECNKKMILLVVGEKRWWTKPMERAFSEMEFKADVVFTGRLSQENLAKVMASAHALVYVSFFEGFGIPILEAMSCDVPVITSNITAMPEVAGDAAAFASPFDPESIKNAMMRVATDDERKKRMIEAGRKRREEFSWDKTADLLWNSIEKTFSDAGKKL
ncbi:MAG TPA: glycosyltransferase family 1 protein [Flavobacteriales bacterium]|jgi:glycosyltransferase involved in cell wall biosynthesis|nr:glycosyltransferase family 1 protein [Flavobacteriales bacterium]